MNQPYNPQLHRRRSIRLPNFDYSEAGAYFITICSYRGAHIFGTIDNGLPCLSPIGRLIEEEWYRSAELRPYVDLGAFVVMPNHIHGIVIIKEKREPDRQREEFSKPTRHSIPSIVRGFKAAVSARRHELPGPIAPHIWQRNYYEYVIRNASSFERISEYIHNNPRTWTEDRFWKDQYFESI